MSKISGTSGFMVLKLDMSKVYDWVSWSFLLSLLDKFSFSDLWIKYIQQCTSLISYRVSFNG